MPTPYELMTPAEHATHDAARAQDEARWEAGYTAMFTPSTPGEENVMCISRKGFDDWRSFDGIHWVPDGFLDRKIYYIPRTQAETNPEFKQLIPYVIIVCGERLLTYQRGKRGGEPRLHAKLSIGIGGHINDLDEDYEAGVRREMREEVGIDWYAPPVAALNDDSNDVGRVHLGFVHIDRVFDEGVTARCASILHPQFVDIAWARRNIDLFETWSQICIRNIQDLLKQ